MPYDLDSSILANGIKNTHYFNGRLLTAQDLRDDQTAHRRQRQQLGRAIGYGIVHGLEVTYDESSPHIVNVTPGLALNRLGQALEIPKVPETLTSIQVALLPETEEHARDAGLFATCLSIQTDPVFKEDVFILAMAPASGFQEKAPMNDFNGNGVGTDCDSRYAVEGVQFHLINVSLLLVEPAALATVIDTALKANTKNSLSRARNLLAHMCLNTQESTKIGQDLVAFVQDATPPTGLLDRIPKLTDCAVPLALIYWDNDGIRFLDMWSVRRRLTHMDTSLVWPPPTSDRQLAEGEAAFLQFQQHLASLLKIGNGITNSQLTSAAADNYFEYLPPAGILPVSTAVHPRGFNYVQFFANVNVNIPDEIDYAQVESLLRSSFSYSPIRLNADREFWLYRVAENQEAAEGDSGPQEYLVFTSAHLPYLGEVKTEEAPLAITKLTPAGTPGNPIITGKPLHIEGGNFRFTVGGHRVSFDGNQVNSFDHLVSNDFYLVIDVPAYSGLPKNGRDMELRVDNGLDSVSQTVRVKSPEQALQGNVDFSWNDELASNPVPDPLKIGGEAVIGYFLASRATDAAEFLISAKITEVEWDTEITILDENQEPLRNDFFKLDQGEKRPFYVHLANIPEQAARETFRLIITATAGEVVGSLSQPFTVGEKVEPPDITISVALNNFDAFTAAGAFDKVSTFDHETQTIELQSGSSMNIDFLLTFEEKADFFDVTLTRTSGSEDWLIGLEQAASKTSQQTLEFNEAQAIFPVNENLNIKLQANTDASDTGELELRIQRRGAANDHTIIYQLQKISGKTGRPSLGNIGGRT